MQHYATLEHTWPFALVTIGSLHVLHNCSERFCESLPHWDWFVGLLRTLSHFLSSKPALSRFRDELRNTTLQPLLCLLDRPCHRLYTGRWGSMTLVLSEVLRLKPLLVQGWRLSTFSRGASAAHAQPRASKNEGDEDVASPVASTIMNHGMEDALSDTEP